ncbi:hypothetical protein DB346_10565 [Verrucomicrobia bacterium LW23]|nr:hypothetical protein DB346_10565 [Verrucomicrobia bacterium LW23]
MTPSAQAPATSAATPAKRKYVCPGLGLCNRTWTASALLVLVLLTGYMLSIGPVAYFSCKLSLGSSRYSYVIAPAVHPTTHAYVMEGTAVSNPHPIVERIYLPLMLFCTYVPYADTAMNSYLKLWDKTFLIEKKV